MIEKAQRIVERELGPARVVDGDTAALGIGINTCVVLNGCIDQGQFTNVAIDSAASAVV